MRLCSGLEFWETDMKVTAEHHPESYTITEEHIERTTETKRRKDQAPGTRERVFRRGDDGLHPAVPPNSYWVSVS